MSVINKMLQDLEQRQQSAGAVANKDHAPQPRSGRNSYYVGLVLLAMLILLGVLWQGRDAPSTSAASVATALSSDLKQASALPGQQRAPDQADPANIMAILSAASDTTTTLEKKAKPITAAEPIGVTLPAAQPQTAVQTAQRITIPISSTPLSVDTVQVAAADIESPSVPKPQATINKQPLSARAQQQNMALRANASEAAGDTSGAIVIWQQIVSQHPADENGYLNLARLWLKQQQIISASQVLLQARQNGVLSAEINMQLAQLAVRQGQWQQALEFLPDQFDLAIEPEYFGFKATVLQQLQQYGAALNWYQRLQQLQPDQGRWSLGAGLASEQLGQPLQANQYYQHAWQHRQALSVSSHNFIQQRLKATEP